MNKEYVIEESEEFDEHFNVLEDSTLIAICTGKEAAERIKTALTFLQDMEA